MIDGDRADQPARAFDRLAVDRDDLVAGLQPARAAGPVRSSAAIEHAVSSRSSTETPSQPRSIEPLASNWATTRLTVSLGMAKPMPTEAPVGETMTELTPMTWPSILNTGPPELPGLIGASSCRKLSNGPEPRSRPSAETMPAVTDPPSPNGLPAARIQSPTSALREVAPGHGGQRLVGVDLDHGDVGQLVLADEFGRVLMAVGQ